MAALVCSELAGVYNGHGTSLNSRSNQSSLGSSPPNFSYGNRFGGDCSFAGAASSSFNGQKGGLRSVEGKGKGKRREEVGVATASLGGFFGGLFKGADTGEGARQQYAPLVARVNAMEVEMQASSDDGLRNRTVELQKRSRGGESLESLLPVCFLIPRDRFC